MADEKVFTIPLRGAFDEQRSQRAKVAVNIVRDYLKKHMKSDNINIGDSINKQIWAKGIQKPPRKIRIHALKENEIVYSELLDVDIKTPSAEEVKKKEQKEKEKKERIKEERKERKKMSIQEELEAEDGKAVEDVEEPAEKTVLRAKSQKTTEPKEQDITGR